MVQWLKAKLKQLLEGPYWEKPVRGKGKFHPKTGYEGPEEEYKYRSTLSLTLALDGVGGQRHALADLPPGKTRYPLNRRMVRPQDRSALAEKPTELPGPWNF